MNLYTCIYIPENVDETCKQMWMTVTGNNTRDEVVKSSPQHEHAFRTPRMDYFYHAIHRRITEGHNIHNSVGYV